MKNEETINSNGSIYSYINWPLYIMVINVILIGICANFSIEMTLLLIVVFIFELIITLYLFFTRNTRFHSALMNFVDGENSVLKNNLKNINSPFCICHTNGTIVWANDSFLKLDKDIAVGKNISKILLEVNDKLFESDALNINNISFAAIKDRKYKIHISTTKYNNIILSDENKIFDENDNFIMMLFDDITDYYDLKVNYENEKVVIGLIYIDNYEEVTETGNIEDSKASMLISLMDRKLARYITNNSGILKKLENYKYFFITGKYALEEMIKDKFSILDQTKDIIASGNIPLTLSIGIGFGGKSIESDYDFAGEAIDMALSRGGDQVVIKNKDRLIFFGGKTSSVDSNQSVRARVRAESLREIFASKDKVFIMGHVNGDLDSFGASIAVYLMALKSGKEAYIVQNSITEPVKELKQKFLDNEAYLSDMFISGDVAINLANPTNSILVLVDHNTSSLADEKRLIDMDLPIVIIDHHRVQASTITNTVLSYIESGSSSASEMTVNLMKFFDDSIKLKPLEAECLLSGIMLDTLNFTYRASSKTYDAASLLRKRGADINKVRKILRLNKENEQIKNEVISNVEFYKDCFAIAYIPDVDRVNDISILASQIANELINIKGIKASIVIYERNGKFSISSRSIDEANVQVLMEKLGGGGHSSQAGAILDVENLEIVVSLIKNCINEMIDNKEILI